MTNNIKDLIFQSTKKLSEAQEIFRHRRINWALIEKTINSEFSAFVESCSNNKFYYDFIVANYKDHPHEHSIEIRCVNHPKTSLKKINTVNDENPNVFEKGGNLVVSQGHQGLILFMFTPLKTDKVEPNFREILISPLVDPRKIDARYLNNILKKYLLLIRYTSLNGDQTLSLIERLKVSLMFIMDVRHKHNLVRSIISMQNEWSKLVIAALLGATFTYYFSAPQ